MSQNKTTLKDVLPNVDYHPVTGQVITSMDELSSQIYANALMAVRQGEVVTITPVYKLAQVVLNKNIQGYAYAKVYSGYPTIDNDTGILHPITLKDFHGEKIKKAQETWQINFDPKGNEDTEHISKQIFKGDVIDILSTADKALETLTQDSIMIANEFEGELERKIFNYLSYATYAFDEVFDTKEFKSQEDYVKAMKNLAANLNTPQIREVTLETAQDPALKWALKTTYNASDFVRVVSAKRNADMSVDLKSNAFNKGELDMGFGKTIVYDFPAHMFATINGAIAKWDTLVIHKHALAAITGYADPEINGGFAKAFSVYTEFKVRNIFHSKEFPIYLFSEGGIINDSSAPTKGK